MSNHERIFFEIVQLFIWNVRKEENCCSIIIVANNDSHFNRFFSFQSSSSIVARSCSTLTNNEKFILHIFTMIEVHWKFFKLLEKHLEDHCPNITVYYYSSDMCKKGKCIFLIYIFDNAHYFWYACKGTTSYR